MSNETSRGVEILPPSHGEADLRLDRPLQGISLLNRAKYYVARKELEAYISALRLRNEAIRELTTGQELRERYYTKTLTRISRMNELRQIEEDKIMAELAALQEAKEDREIRDLRRRLEKAELQIKLAAANRQLKEEENPTPPPPPVSAAERATAEIKRVNTEFETLTTAFKSAAGDAGEADEETRQFLDSVELARREKMNAILEAL